MPQQIPPLLSRLNAYHHNRNVLFQFIFSEFLTAFEEVNSLQKIASSLEKEWNTEKVQALIASTEKLSGCSHASTCFFSWILDTGNLVKLKNYTYFFLQQNGVPENKDLISIHRHCDKAWIYCLQSLDILRSVEYDSSQNSPNTFNDLQDSLEKMNSTILSLARLIAKVAKQFSGDENVVYFILRHKEQINALYGPNFVLKLLNEMFPDGLEKAESFVSSRYAARGFENILPLIANKFTKLETAIR